MAERTSLEDHEVDVLHRLQEIYSINKKREFGTQTTVNRTSVISKELLDCVSPGLREKKELSGTEKRLLGQLAVVAFQGTDDADYITLPNFPHAMRIQLARMPRQRKKGDELHNTSLYAARIKVGKTWMRHLPGDFNDELIAALFLDIDEERASKVMQKYHNRHMRMNSHDSASLKSFVGLNDSQYVRFMRSTFYFAGLRILAPIREIYLLRSLKIKEDYTTLTRRVVDMTRVTKKGKSSKITRKIKVGVMTVRPFECILNSAGSLIKQGTLLKSTERFRSPIPLPAGVEGCRGARSLPRRALLEPRTPPPVLQPCAPPSAPQGWRSRRLPSPCTRSHSPHPPRAARAPVGATGVVVVALALEPCAPPSAPQG